MKLSDIGAALTVIVVIVVIAVAAITWPGRNATPDVQIDAHQHVIDSLGRVVSALVVKNGKLVLARDSLLRSRDSVVASSTEHTKIIFRDRASLPTNPPDSTIRVSYGDALNQLDTSLGELVRKDKIIDQDKVSLQQGFEIETNLRVQLSTVTYQKTQQALISDEWKYKATHQSRCGRKCGIAIGVLSVAGSLFVLDKAQQVLEHHR